MLLLTAKQIKKAAIDNGGVSVNYHGKQPTSGYMVSTPNNEIIVDKLTCDVIRKQQLKLHSSDAFVGIWYDSYHWYLDISYNYENLTYAIACGRKNGQIAIYDVVTNKTIFL